MSNTSDIHMVSHEGIVVSIDGNHVQVKIMSMTACDGCRARNTCMAAHGKEKIIDAITLEPLKKDDAVLVKMEEKLGWIALFYAFFLPLFILLALLFSLPALGFSETLAGIIALGEGIRADVLDLGLGQRMMRDVHVQRRVVRHGPGHAELVRQIVPGAAVPLPSDDLALEIRRGSGVDVAGIDAQPLEHRLAGPGQLLHGVHDRHVVLDAQVPDQGLVGDAMDARLVAAQIDRHAVRLLVVQRLEQSLARSHGLFSRRHDLPPLPPPLVGRNNS